MVDHSFIHSLCLLGKAVFNVHSLIQWSVEIFLGDVLFLLNFIEVKKTKSLVLLLKYYLKSAQLLM